MVFFPKQVTKELFVKCSLSSLCFHIKQSRWAVSISFNPVGQATEVISAGSGSADTPSDFHFCQKIVFLYAKNICKKRKNKRLNYLLPCLYRKCHKLVKVYKGASTLQKTKMLTYRKKCKAWIWRCRVAMIKHWWGGKSWEQCMHLQRQKKKEKGNKTKRKWQFVLAGWKQNECYVYVKVILVL